jgi:hypothetical protein
MPGVRNCEASTAYFILIGGGLQGFRSPIVQDSFIVDGIGALGNKQSERNLTYVEVSLAGHM